VIVKFGEGFQRGGGFFKLLEEYTALVASGCSVAG